MKFGMVRIGEAAGTILAHSVKQGALVLKKGRRLSEADVAALEGAGVTEIMAAHLEAGDVAEDDAARRIASRLAGAGIRTSEPFTGRVNLYANGPGVAMIDRERIIALNLLDESVTVATVPPYERVTEGQMVATVKIIAFAVAEAVMARADGLAAQPLVAVAPFAPKSAGLILTELPGTKASVLAKRKEVLEARLVALGSSLATVATTPHRVGDVRAAITRMAAAGADPILLFGASAIVDRGDVLPAALLAAGGEVVHLGMPVDPGNLLMLGRLGAVDVIGVPSCAASPKTNGFDWVLERRLAELPIGSVDLAEMGPGGLLKEIESRPQPREGGRAEAGAPSAAATGRRLPRVAAVVLAAGRSSRMGAQNKLLLTIDGEPMVRRVAEAALASQAGPVVVVTGHEGEAVAGALAGLDVTLVANPEFAAGMSTSLVAGIAALPAGVDGALILLADMPDVSPADIDRLIAAFAPKEGRVICVPVVGGRRGNPVLWGAELFGEMGKLTGDAGARGLIDRHGDRLVEVEMRSPGVLVDIDTPEALAARRSEGATGGLLSDGKM